MPAPIAGTTQTTGKECYEFHEALAIKAGLPKGTGSIASANSLAGTKNRELVECLNILAGNSKKNYRELAGVLNQLAGTTGLEAQGAASRWAGR
jgi:hypothetical protein